MAARADVLDSFCFLCSTLSVENALPQMMGTQSPRTVSPLSVARGSLAFVFHGY